MFYMYLDELFSIMEKYFVKVDMLMYFTSVKDWYLGKLPFEKLKHSWGDKLSYVGGMRLNFGMRDENREWERLL
jgi:hypothetical protein